MTSTLSSATDTPPRRARRKIKNDVCTAATTVPVNDNGKSVTIQGTTEGATHDDYALSECAREEDTVGVWYSFDLGDMDQIYQLTASIGNEGGLYTQISVITGTCKDGNLCVQSSFITDRSSKLVDLIHVSEIK